MGQLRVVVDFWSLLWVNNERVQRRYMTQQQQIKKEKENKVSGEELGWPSEEDEDDEDEDDGGEEERQKKRKKKSEREMLKGHVFFRQYVPVFFCISFRVHYFLFILTSFFFSVTPASNYA
jgi:hypothetical protein